MTLTKNEQYLISHAVYLTEGFMDFENNDDEQFKQRYGFSKEEADEARDSLRKKLKPATLELKAKLGY